MSSSYSPRRVSKRAIAWFPKSPKEIVKAAKRFQHGFTQIWTAIPEIGDKMTNLANGGEDSVLSLLDTVMSDDNSVTSLQDGIEDASVARTCAGPTATVMEPISYAHLPPPPPPPPPIFQPSSTFLVGSENLSHQPMPNERSRVDEIEDQMEKLHDARETLMGTRFQLARDRGRMHTIHNQAVLEGGVALEKLRRFLDERIISLPPDIKQSFEQVHVLRDQLGLREAEYSEAEQQYNLEEIRYTEKETDLLKELRVQADKEGLVRRSEEWEMVKHVRDDTSLHFPPNRQQRTSQSHKMVETFSTVSAYRGDLIQSPQQDLLEYKTGINKWFLDKLCQSNLERAHQKKFITDVDSLSKADFVRWWNLLGKDWYLLRDTGTQFAPGNDAISNDWIQEHSFVESEIPDADLFGSITPRKQEVQRRERIFDTPSDFQSLPSDRPIQLIQWRCPGDLSAVTRQNAYPATDLGTKQVSITRKSDFDRCSIHSAPAATKFPGWRRAGRLPRNWKPHPVRRNSLPVKSEYSPEDRAGVQHLRVSGKPAMQVTPRIVQADRDSRKDSHDPRQLERSIMRVLPENES